MAVIEVDHVSKMYRLGVLSRRTLTRDVQSWWARVRGKEDPNEKVVGAAARRRLQGVKDGDQVWALRDVTLDVQQGEVLGIIGKNGAGKSTLLKILSRVTAPSKGEVRARGRIASLLEVGTGFHPELTGRENVFLNGAILGMRKAEIERKFDAIVDFAEVDQYIDTPVKRYSSGMYVRLAFAVAAHLEPEILIVDEVLAVGDAAFQKKCLGKMGSVSSEGRTVLFVSHNMSAVRQLCGRSILLREGTVAMNGPTGSVVDTYLQEQLQNDGQPHIVFERNDGQPFQVLQLELLGPKGDRATSFECDDEIIIRLHCISRNPVPGLYGYMTISRGDGTLLLESDSNDIQPNVFDALPAGNHVFDVTVPSRILAPGRYMVYFNFGSPSAVHGFNVDTLGTVCSFTLTDNFSKRGNRRSGYLGTLLPWTPTVV